MRGMEGLSWGVAGAWSATKTMDIKASSSRAFRLADFKIHIHCMETVHARFQAMEVEGAERYPSLMGLLASVDVPAMARIAA